MFHGPAALLIAALLQRTRHFSAVGKRAGLGAVFCVPKGNGSLFLKFYNFAVKTVILGHETSDLNV